MSESILKALMQLFAIIANVNIEGVSKTSRKIVEYYLKQHLNQELTNEYLELFDEFLRVYHREIIERDSAKGRKRTSAHSVKVLKICQQINEELKQDQKVFVLLQLLQFVKFGEEITEKEMDFVKTVGEIFNISRAEYENMKSFVLETPENIPSHEDVLTIDSKESVTNPHFKHIIVENLQGRIVVLRILSENMYAFYYSGGDVLFMNGHPISEARIYTLTHGSSIRNPKVSPIYYSDVIGKFLKAKAEATITFTAKEVEFRFKNSENGIHRFNFSEESGHLIGIMGGSGVGKSTLLNIFNGTLQPQKGQILINGYDIYEDKEKLEGVIGYVPQDDLLIEELTVFQNLYYNAKLCFDNFTEEEIVRTVERVLKDLDLYEIQHLKVGNPLNKFISGGQRKRLNIALELIREPSVLFVDEPTSGLSSMDSEMVMDLLKELTLKGKLIIVNIHQPSSDIYKMFDKLIILDKGGYPIYQGNPIDAVVYFKTMSNYINASESECLSCGNVNPEQVLQIVEAKVVNEYGKLTDNRKVSPKEWYDLYRENIEAKQEIKVSTEKLPENQFKIPNKLKQFKIFSIRDILSKLTNKQYLLINFLEPPLLAFIIGYFTKFISGKGDTPDVYLFSENENFPQYIFMAIIAMLFIGMTVSAEEIIRDRKILQREAFLNLSRFSYINSKVILMFVISAIQSLTFVLIGNSILNIKGMFLSYWLVLFSTACCANMMGLNISAGLNSVVTIYILIPFLLVPQLLLSGVIVKFDKLHKSLASELYVPFVGDIMTSRWAYEALAVHQFKNNKYQKNFYEIEKTASDYSFWSNYLVPELKSRTNTCEKNIIMKENPEKTAKLLTIIKNDLQRLQRVTKGIKSPLVSAGYNYLDSLNIKSFTPHVAQKIREYLDEAKIYFSAQYNAVTRKKDEKVFQMTKLLNGKEQLNKLKEDYHNGELSDIVQNRKDIYQIVEGDNRMVRKIEPIYYYPESNNGRAHFYAPIKRIMGKNIDTYWFNTIVLWLMSLILYFTLLYDVFKKSINKIDNLSAYLPIRAKKKKD